MTSFSKFDEKTMTTQGQLNGLLQSDNPYMKQARRSGEEHANKRGLLNSSIAAGASESAAINAALPIAQADASAANAKHNAYLDMGLQKSLNTHNTNLQKQLSTHNTDQAIRQGAYDVTANTQGAYLSAIDKITNNAMVSINEIETAEGIEQAEKDKMIANTTARRDADLAWTRKLYSNMPTWDMSWIGLERMPAAPGL